MGSGLSRREARRREAPLLAFLLMAGLWVTVTSALQPANAEAQVPTALWTSCTFGSGAGKCDIPRGVAADPSLPGHIYVANQDNLRIEEFTVWGEFVKAWGWGVRDGSSELQICNSETGCQVGIAGSGAGQFGPVARAQGIAVDFLGNIYVVDRNNLRVQKFDSDGNFLLMFGGDVNKTKVEAAAPEAQQNLCPVDLGDVCQAGTSGTGSGQFNAWPVSSFITVGPDDTIYVGDQERIQRFDPAGTYIGDVPDPDEVIKNGQFVASLAADGAGALLVSFATSSFGFTSKPDVFKLDSNGEELCKIDVASPRAVAVGIDGEAYVFDASIAGARQFSPSCDDLEESFGAPAFAASTGIATGSACLSAGTDIYVSNSVSSGGFVRAFGPPPDRQDVAECLPPEAAPRISSQHAVSVDTDSALLRAKINPLFWGDTSYHVEYGTEECSEGGCEALPDTELGSGVVNADVTGDTFLSDLEPGETYHFRFVAQSGGGGPTYGGDPDGEGPQEASFEEGLEGTFSTFAVPSEPSCANAEFRIGPSAKLPDCRAYEMVTPLDKNGSDVQREGVDQARPDGSQLTYSAVSASFADPEAAPQVSQYVATRHPLGSASPGWSSENVSAPRSSHSLYEEQQIYVFDPFRVFSEDLCEAWVFQDTDVALAPGAPPGFGALYRRDNCAGGDYEALTTVEPSTDDDAGAPLYWPVLQGFTPGGDLGVFRANGALTPDAYVDPKEEGYPAQLYAIEDGGGLHLVSILPDGSAASTDSAAGTHYASYGLNIKDRNRHAVSEDGTRIFWSKEEGVGSLNGRPGWLYLRVNPTQPESARQLGFATGSGDLIGPASGVGNTVNNSKTISKVETASGIFSVGQSISGSGLTAGTTITEIEPEVEPGKVKLKIDQSATATKAGVEITGASSQTVSNLVTTTGAFAVGQKISGDGIPFGSTITAVGPGSLTLSAAATKTAAGAALSATSECTEADKACTIAVSESVTSAPAEFQAASADGSTAIFSAGGNLYEFDVATQSSQLIAGGVLANLKGGLMGASDDASRIYFASTQVLTPDPNPVGDTASAGKPNLYLYEVGEPPAYSFVAPLSDSDLTSSSAQTANPLANEPDLRSSRVTPDGLHAAFSTRARATSYDNTDVGSEEADAEVYLYDAAVGPDVAQLRCVSCNPSGARPSGRSLQTIGGKELSWTAALISGWPSSFQPSRALADGGGRLYFESFDALLPRDTNGAVDVYQWEAPGEGDCGSASTSYFAASDGCLSLMSAGTSPDESHFIDASADGSDVFIETQSSLVPQDTGLIDIYDARVGGGFHVPPPEEPPCEGDACQPTAAAPEFQMPSSAATQAPGNPKPKKGRRCPAGKRKVQRKGKQRCVPKRRQQGKAGRNRRAGR
jgi:hypothetical protein